MTTSPIAPKRTLSIEPVSSTNGGGGSIMAAAMAAAVATNRAAGPAFAYANDAQRSVLPPMITKAEFDEVIRKLKHPDGVYKNLKAAYKLTPALREKFPTYIQFVNSLNEEQRTKLKEIGCKVTEPFLIPYPDALPNNSYSSQMTNQQFADVIHRMQKKGISFKESLGVGECGTVHKVSDDEFNALKASLTPLGKEMLGRVAPHEAFPMDQHDEEHGNYRDIQDTVMHRGVLCQRKTKQVEIGGWGWTGRILAAIGTIATAGIPLAFEGARKFHKDTWNHVSTKDPTYEELNAATKANTYQSMLGYNPEESNSLDTLWRLSVARQPEARLITSVNTPLEKGCRYKLAGHEFIYSGEGHVLFAPQGNSSKSYDVAFYDNKTGKPWENGKDLLDQIVLFARGQEIVSNKAGGAHHFVMDTANRKIYSYKKSADLNEGFEIDKGKEIDVGMAFWKPMKKKAAAAESSAKPKKKLSEQEKLLRKHGLTMGDLDFSTQQRLNDGPTELDNNDWNNWRRYMDEYLEAVAQNKKVKK